MMASPGGTFEIGTIDIHARIETTYRLESASNECMHRNAEVQPKSNGVTRAIDAKRQQKEGNRMLSSTRLDQFGIADFTACFDAEELKLCPGSYRESWDFNSIEGCTHHGAFHFANLPKPLDFWLYLPATASGVAARHMQMCQRVLHALNRLDSRAREPFDVENARMMEQDQSDFNLDRDVMLDYVLIEDYGAELHYQCNRWNNEYGSHFKYLERDEWEYSDLI